MRLGCFARRIRSTRYLARTESRTSDDEFRTTPASKPFSVVRTGQGKRLVHMGRWSTVTSFGKLCNIIEVQIQLYYQPLLTWWHLWHVVVQQQRHILRLLQTRQSSLVVRRQFGPKVNRLNMKKALYIVKEAGAVNDGSERLSVFHRYLPGV